MSKKKATGTNTAAGSSSMKRNLDTGVEVYDKNVREEETTPHNKRKQNTYLDIFNKNNQYFNP